MFEGDRKGLLHKLVNENSSPSSQGKRQSSCPHFLRDEDLTASSTRESAHPRNKDTCSAAQVAQTMMPSQLLSGGDSNSLPSR